MNDTVSAAGGSALAHLLPDAVAILAFCGVGVVLMAMGFILVDLITPGNLRRQIWAERNRNASILLASNLIAVGIIVSGAIYASDDNILLGTASSFIYGLIGLIVMGVAFLLMDLMTPGKLGKMLVDTENHPAVYVSAAMHLAVALVVLAGLS